MAIKVHTKVEKNDSSYYQETFQSPYVDYDKISSFVLNISPEYVGKRWSLSSIIQTGKSNLQRTEVRTTDSVSSPSLHSYTTVRVQFKRKFRLKEPKKPKVLPPLKAKAWRPVKPPVVQKGRKRVSKTALKRWRINVIKQSIAYDQYVSKVAAINRLRADTNKRRSQIYAMRVSEYERKKALHKQGRLTKRRTTLKRERPNNPYSRTIVRDMGVYGYISWYRRATSFPPAINPNGPKVSNWGVQVANGTPYAQTFTKPALANNLLVSTNNRCIFNLKRKKIDQVAHIGNILAERHQTFSYLTTKLRQIIAIKSNPAKFLKDFLGTSRKEKFTKNVSDEFLALQFGVKPLINEVYSAFQHLKKESLLRDKLVIRSSTSQSDTSVFKTSASSNAGSIGGMTILPLEPALHTVKVTRKVTTSYVLEYDVVNGASDLLQRFGLQNPAEILWEVMPWSFVVDWFLPVGDWIRSFNNANLVFARGTKVVTITSTYNGTAIWDGHPHTDFAKGWFFKGNVEGYSQEESKTRTLLTAEPFTHYPEFRNPFSIYHVLETLALLRQRLK